MKGLRVAAILLVIVCVPLAAHAATVSSNPDGTSTVADGGYSFKNFQLGQLPAEYCPNPNSPCQNQTAEPQIRADNAGNFYGASENGLAGGTEAWKSTDGGLHYVHLPSPNEASISAGGSPTNVSPAGGDVDVATASAKNANGLFNVYVASLELVNVAVSTSGDGGHTWAVNHKAATISGDDREWIAADGANKVCISYRDAAAATLPVDCSYTAGQPEVGGFTQHGDAIDAAHPYIRTNFQIGNLAIDQNYTNPACTPVVPTTVPPSSATDPTTCDYIYQTFSSIDPADLTPCSTASSDCNTHVVYVAVSTDGGRTFTDNVVYDNPNHLVSYGHQFTNVSVDRAGNVYSFFTDDQNVYYKYSTDHGTTWRPSGAPIRVSKAPATTAIFPWSVAGAPGKVDLVYYGTSYPAGGNGCATTTVTCQHPDNYPATAAWYVYFAQNLNALGNPATWTQAQASPIIHYGGVCEGGIGCTGNRDLYDDFGVAASPTTGRASIIYSDDQFDQYNHTLTYASNCSASASNTPACDHTSIATQTSGPGIFGTTSGTGGGNTGG